MFEDDPDRGTICSLALSRLVLHGGALWLEKYNEGWCVGRNLFYS